ncbi:ribonuclease H1 [Manduca sexta]|uniref:Ribonuclease H1 n=1 Tax=Manduca sexta TaxID=7130 RepID=A0A921ZDK7_MANSE|nr:ribonuclease H1 [Manduca sexta]KAG6455605.1 hypothetical protein O3G_MSEX009273 [Manduca sexta]
MSIWRVAIRNVYLNRTSLWKNNVLIVTTMPFYAVAKGRTSGIFMTWADCEAQVKGFSGARYKKFDSVTDAQTFVTAEGGKVAPPKPMPSKVKHTSQNNLKRPLTTQKSEKKVKKSKIKPQSEDKDDSASTENSFDNSDDLDTILNKQMDDIEARLKGFEKGIDKIIKNSMKGKQTILIDPPEKKKKSTSQGFEMDNEGFVKVYTDGACSSNGRSGARAGLGVYWGEDHPLNISEPVSGRATNNCGEIQAATKAIKQALDNGVMKLAVNTDSKFLINSVTKWMPGWKRKGWKLQSGEPVKNEIDFKDLDSVQNKLQVKWNYVEAHRGVHGNEMADQLAKAGAALYNK